MKIKLFKEIFTCSSMTVHLYKESKKINTRRGVRQGETISPKLFTAALESIFRRLTWEIRGLKIDGEYLSHLRFVDDIFTCANIYIYIYIPLELQTVLQKLANKSENQGLKTIKWKTGDDGKRHTNICHTHTERERCMFHLPWIRDTTPKSKTKTRIFKEASRPGGQYSPCTVISSK